ncbi:hypothetical protein C343_06611 [Cryptococcus neoformans C23]|uniref:Uncharacterized protein n=1 Tax=Cryptococcus neoformans (strain H99 / ATCC 208821 / CBS 10515 / FGSC 9487) TaxID=235443 RepID=J9W0Y8_CRYN9|nr:hypothetical protein CNAG_06395 [Cryptococcus neoformans var. grubii H99]AFR98634.1 hypothetical protein CNAG_06395 [Cryptococcus neoformans var. grubii H99]AUB28806.1 hypothetical protein CKF44_06395 [Cryptococcus neoformans var. grubii]OWZ26960.1 hypothetical protein C347_06609 [Cryptococcus neoformans var. grubii AD2-60a]OWZ38821.1 hypothetical protein C343_06611 [Cryptococcus neoformans var. grubii C23]|eukprot:XP_012053465.1 hypothetical protein CNAG_06395 [Cryptococcus neoformans var. grubii H99]
MRCTSIVKFLLVLALFAQAAPAINRDLSDGLLPANADFPGWFSLLSEATRYLMSQHSSDIPDLPFPSKVGTTAKPPNHGINEARDFGDILSDAESIWDEATSAAVSILHETTKIASLLDKATAAIGSVAAAVTSEGAKVVDDLTDRAAVVTESDKE